MKIAFLGQTSRIALVASASLGLSSPLLAASFSVPPDSATTAKTVSNNETGVVTAGNTLSVTGTAITWMTGASAPGVVITNNGTISATSRTIDTGTAALNGNFTLLNNVGALVTATSDAFRIQSATVGAVTVNNFATIQSTGNGRALDFNAVTSATSVFNIANAASATIRAVGNDAIRIGTGTTTINNSGLIDSTAGAFRAIRMNTNLANVTSVSIFNNAGATIQSSDDAIQINGSGASNATTAARFSIDNAGTIRSTATGQALDFDNLSSTAATVAITNRASGLITSTDADAIRPGQNFTINNYGQIIANALPVPADRPGADGIDLQLNHSGTVNNYSGGLISGAKSGTASDVGSVITVFNDVGATIIGRNGAGVGSGGNAIVTNYGTLTGAIDTTSARGDGDGIDTDFILTLTNYGLVQGTGAKGVDAGGRFNNSEGVAIGGGTIRNYGTIVGANAGIVVNNDSNLNQSRSGSGALDLINYAGGTITGQSSYAIRSENKTGTAVDNDTIVNYGSIIGNGAIPDPNGVTLLQNGNPDPGSVGTLNGVTYTGTGATRFIRGDGAAIQTGEGNDVLSNYGTIVGNNGRAISMEGGNDTLNLYGGSSITGRIDGGVGTDTINLFGPGVGTLSNVINFEALNVQGGVWSLPDAQSYVLGTTVSGGTLLVNGVLDSTVTVNAGGTLGGNGTVGTTLINGGTLSPGNSIGALTVQGNLVFTAAAQYLVEVSPSNADRVNVTGSATLGGATVAANFAGGSYVARQYTILNAAGGVSGTFGAQVNTNLPSSFASTLSYDANNAYLNLVLDYAAVTGLSTNQRNVATALVNFFNTTGGIPLAFGGLTPAGLTQVSGELGAGTQQTTFDAMGLFMGLMTDPLNAGRGDGASPQGGAFGYADEALGYAAKRKPADAMAAIYRKAPPLVAPSFAQRWSIWSAGFGGSQTTDGNATLGSNTATSRIYGGAVGLDYRLSPDTLVGVALAGGGTNFAVANSGTGRSDLFQAGAFVRHNVGASYITAALAYGWQDVTTDRSVGADRLNARFTTDTLSGRIEGGYRVVDPMLGIGFTPYAAGQFTTVYLPDYRETAGVASTFGLNYAGRDVTASRSELGLRSDKSYAMPDGVFTLRGRAAWAHNFNPDRSIAATFQTLPGASFVVNGAAQARDAALVTASAEMKWRSNWAIAATFEGEFSDVTRSYAGKGVVRYAW